MQEHQLSAQIQPKKREEEDEERGKEGDKKRGKEGDKENEEGVIESTIQYSIIKTPVNVFH